MYAYDFEYDGRLLSDFGFIVCRFDERGGVEATEKGSQVNFTLAPVHAGKRHISVGTKYESCLSTTFQICKDPDKFREDEMEVSADEFRALSRWLNRRAFCWFKSYDPCEPEKIRPWVRASFGLTRIDIDNVTYGVELEMKTDSPFGYGDEQEIELDFTGGELTKKLFDLNDEVGETYPDVTITCKAAGTLTLTDDVTGCETTIENCVNGEVITMNGDTMIIETSVAAHDIANDFNYDFFHFGNTLENTENNITANRACTMVIRYRPIIKDTI